MRTYSHNIIQVNYLDDNGGSGIVIAAGATDNVVGPGNVIANNHCDGQVNVLDLAQVAGAWGCTGGDPCYLPWMDQNQDGRIDIVDIMRIARYWEP